MENAASNLLIFSHKKVRDRSSPFLQNKLLRIWACTKTKVGFGRKKATS